MVGISVPRSTAGQSGLAMNAAPTYAKSTRASHLKMRRISVYEPNTCSSRIAAVVGTTMAGRGTPRVNTSIAAAIPPMSAPASIVFPMTTPMSATRSSHGG